MHRVPVRVAARQRPPLATRRGDVEDRVDDVALGVLRGAAHPAPTRIRRHQISNEFPFLVAQVLLAGLPCLRLVAVIPSHAPESTRHEHTRAPQTGPYQHKLSKQPPRTTFHSQTTPAPPTQHSSASPEEGDGPRVGRIV